MGMVANLPRPARSVGSFQKRFHWDEFSVVGQVFFPIENGRGSRVKSGPSTYFRQGTALGTAGFANLPPLILKFLAHVVHPLSDHQDVQPNLEKGSLPVILFSHGLGGNAEVYTALCSHLASEGFVVVAIEHADGSGAYAVTHSEEEVFYTRPPSTMEYTRENVVEFRSRFFKHRMKELECVLGSLASVKTDDPTEENVLNSIDMSNKILCGHSFGGATAVYAAHFFPKDYFKCIVLHDLWPFPVPVDICDVGVRAPPTVSILSEVFAKGDEVHITEELAANSGENFLNFYITGTVHTSFSDCPFWLPVFAGKRLNLTGERDRDQVLSLLTDLTSNFIKDVIGCDDYAENLYFKCCTYGDAIRLMPSSKSKLKPKN